MQGKQNCRFRTDQKVLRAHITKQKKRGTLRDFALYTVKIQKFYQCSLEIIYICDNKTVFPGSEASNTLSTSKTKAELKKTSQFSSRQQKERIDKN